MTDAHCHLPSGGTAREFVIGRDFVGIHPWNAETADDSAIEAIRAEVAAKPSVGVGEIGLDRLHSREISKRMREVFAAQLEIAAAYSRPVVLHGAKCWGQVVAACKPYAGRIPTFLFHGFSRSEGLIGEIAAMHGFISVGPAVLNDHAINYHKLVKAIPAEMLLLESDRDGKNGNDEVDLIWQVAEKVAALRGMKVEDLEKLTDYNADVLRRVSCRGTKEVRSP